MAVPSAKKIRILMFMGDAGLGGTQAYVMNVLRNIDHARFQIDFAVNFRVNDGYENEMEALGSQIHVIPKFKGTNYFEYKAKVHDLLRKGKYDIVHGHSSSSAALYLRLAKRHGCVTIAHSHSAGYRGNNIERMIKWMFTLGVKKQADYWFACSALAAKKLFGRYYAQNKKYYYIANAVIVKKYCYDEHIRQKIREKMGLNETDVLYGHVGTFSPPKNHDFLIQIFEALQAKQGEKAHLVLLGDGSLKAKIKQDVSRRGLEKQVFFMGNVSNVNEYMMAMDALIFPSLFEGFPLVLIEAQASGLFSVISDRITKETYVTECIVPLSLDESAEYWAEKAKNIPIIDRKAMNVAVADTDFNICNSIGQLMEIYEKMVCNIRQRIV